MKPIKQICIIAGEASGDLHGASLVKALKESGGPLVFFGLGGPRLREAGVEMVYPPPLNVVGFTEVVAKIAHLFRAFQKVKQTLVDRSADLLVLIDYPELNLRLARFAHRRNIPVLFYISPQVWAWRAGRVKTIARVVDRMAVILPFEEEFYRARGMAVEFVGHPLGDVLEETLSLKEDPELPGVEPGSTVIGLLPGSRPTEVNQILPVLLDTAWDLKQRYAGPLVFWLPIAPSLDPLVIREKAAPYQQRGLSLQLISGVSPAALKRCDLALVASGTATLEAAILGVPMIIVYKVSAVNYWIAKRLIKVPYIGLVNWIAGEKIVSEYVQDQAHPRALSEEALKLLNDPVLREELRTKDGPGQTKIGRSGGLSPGSPYGPGDAGRMMTERLLSLVKPYWFRLALAMVCMAVVAGVTALMAYLVKPVLDDIFFQKNTATLSLLPPFIILLYIVKGGFGYGQSYLMSYVGQRIVANLREQPVRPPSAVVPLLL